jgi:two-component system KDP operon response regulator KdpE
LAKILLVDDDAHLMDVIARWLQNEGYEVIKATNGAEALSLTREQHLDLVVLDLKMPEMDGWETCRRLREFADVPILFLTAYVTEAEVVRALQGGADDFMGKPFSLAELSARLEAILRRARSSEAGSPFFEDDVLYIDMSKGIVRKRGQAIDLSPKELKLLACLLRHSDRVMPYSELLREVWGHGYENEVPYVALYMSYLRRKLEDDPHNPVYLRTRHRVGCYFHDPSQGIVAP